MGHQFFRMADKRGKSLCVTTQYSFHQMALSQAITVYIIHLKWLDRLLPVRLHNVITFFRGLWGMARVGIRLYQERLEESLQEVFTFQYVQESFPVGITDRDALLADRNAVPFNGINLIESYQE